MLVLSIVAIAVLLVIIGAREDSADTVALGASTLVITGVVVFIAYMCNAEDYGTIAAQDKVIAVYEKNIDDLAKRLDKIKPANSVLMNADSPVAALVEALAGSNAKLVEAQSKKAEAYVSIAQRKEGVFSFLVRE